ncbi:MAG: hypothetical protein ACI9QL_003641 [Candidatus Omnitrophota bacterium]|jgi:hypothetical protein
MLYPRNKLYYSNNIAQENLKHIRYRCAKKPIPGVSNFFF